MAQTPTARTTDDKFSVHSVSRDQFAPHVRQPRSAPSLTRTIEAAALLADQSISETTLTVPALPELEHCCTAFARGTLINTVMGPIAVEDLIPGDLIETHRGPEPLVWKGSTLFTPGVTNAETSLKHLLRMPADGFGQQDLIMGPAARIVIRQERFSELLNCDAVFVPALDYVDGDRILEITPPGPVLLFHFAVRRHGIVRANGHEVESYHPGRTALKDMPEPVRETMPMLFPHLSELQGFGDMAYPRTTRQAVESLRLM